eukprot:2009389-Pleurochrysis_carterae.AAC.1
MRSRSLFAHPFLFAPCLLFSPKQTTAALDSPATAWGQRAQVDELRIGNSVVLRVAIALESSA